MTGPELRRLVDALRRTIDEVVVTDAPPAVLADAAEQVEAAAALLAPHTPATPPRAHDPSTPLDPHKFFPFSPVIGHYNPLAAPVELAVAADGSVQGRAHFGAAYEGPPGCVHGAMIAAVFDEVLGFANIVNGTPGMTGTLTVRYRRPTPLHADLTVDGRTERVDGRKVFCTGRILHDGTVTAEADGIFIMLLPERAAEVFGNDDRGF